jgi:hypothetical protein
MIDTFNFLDGRPIWLIADPQLVPETPGIARICRTPLADSYSWGWHGLLYAISIEHP